MPASLARGAGAAQGGLAILLALGLATSSCSAVDSLSNKLTGGGPKPGTPGYVTGFLGGVSADEPRAALAAREVLSAGGNAVDAAVAGGLMMSVTLPSRAGLGAGGACLVYDPDRSGVNGGVPEAVVFVAPPGGGTGERPAAVPMLARGLYALHARYGQRPFETLIAPAEQAARFGVPVSRAFVRDLAVVAGPLSGDPVARGIFFQANGQPLGEGMTLLQPELGATLAQLRVAGVGDLYVGALARRMVDASAQAGGGLTAAALREGLPRFTPALVVDGPDHDRVAFLPPPADGGLAAAAAFRALLATPDDLQAAQARALAVAASWRAQGGQGDPMAMLSRPLASASLPALPASAGLVTLDSDGRAVSCSFSMNNLFGTGRVAPGTGVLLAASPSWMPPALLSAGLAWNPNVHAFHAAVAGTGQEGAPLATADALLQTLRASTRIIAAAPFEGPASKAGDLPPAVQGGGVLLRPVPEPGRADVVSCSRYLPGYESTCGWSTDPRGAGLAVGSN